MITAVIAGPSSEEAVQQIREASPEADLLEIRVDLIGTERLKELMAHTERPLLFTLRTKAQGGAFQGSQEEYWRLQHQIASLTPAWIDLEADQPQNHLKEFFEQYPYIKKIHSYHVFESSQDYESLYQRVSQAPANLYKLAVTISSSSELLRFLRFSAAHPDTLIAVPMGDRGSPGRVLGKLFSYPFSYARLNSTLPNPFGQLTLKEMREVYHYAQIEKGAPLYGLIGEKVDASRGHLFHNGYLKGKGVYVKFALEKEELPEFIQEARTLPFCGFSVTMPFKEAILPYLDKIEPDAREIGAVNTVKIERGKWLGTNTDGLGCLHAIHRYRDVKSASLFILGTGGSAKAIAFAAKQAGATPFIVSRKRKSAEELAAKCGGAALVYEEMAALLPEHAIIVKCHPYALDPQWLPLKPTHLLMDIEVSQHKTAFQSHGEAMECTVLDFKPMFEAQAELQRQFWGLFK